VEMLSLLSAALCQELDSASMGGARAISNSRELSLSGDLRRSVPAALGSSPVIRAAVQHVYGADQYVITATKLLEADEGAAPQIPHADDTWNRELFGVVHVRSNQLPTDCVPYDATLPYPPEMRSECSRCKVYVAVPDDVARQRKHMLHGFCCETVGRRCGEAREVSDDDFEQTVLAQLYETFAQLLLRPRAVVECMRPCGNPRPGLGDGVLALPTLVHRGPGGRNAPGAATRSRRVLFFTLRPKFVDERVTAKTGAYDEDGQVHAAWLLWRMHGLPTAAANAEAVCSMYKSLGHDLADYGYEGACMGV